MLKKIYKKIRVIAYHEKTCLGDKSFKISKREAAINVARNLKRYSSAVIK